MNDVLKKVLGALTPAQLAETVARIAHGTGGGVSTQDSGGHAPTPPPPPPEPPIEPPKP